VIKIPAARIVAATLLVSGVAISPLLDRYDEITSPAGDPIQTQTPHFQIQRRQGEILLSGHTSSRAQEEALFQIARSSYPSDRLVTDFEPLGIVPDAWTAVIEQTLVLLQEVRFAEALVSSEELRIRGVIADESTWDGKLEVLTNALPPELAVNTDTVFLDPTVSVPTICERAFSSFKSGPINFEESSAEFRSSAYPRLDRLIALANACEDSRILITGHTDASGSDAWNQQLSVRRASAVGDYVTNGGIDPARLQISGVGSDKPIADDSTRYGRSLNRRIEIALSGNY
jgi:outer membrane protein OmpA-like peptidoglycan-associated protein